MGNFLVDLKLWLPAGLIGAFSAGSIIESGGEHQLNQKSGRNAVN